jgi:hypothetical protein
MTSAARSERSGALGRALAIYNETTKCAPYVAHELLKAAPDRVPLLSQTSGRSTESELVDDERAGSDDQAVGEETALLSRFRSSSLSAGDAPEVLAKESIARKLTSSCGAGSLRGPWQRPIRPYRCTASAFGRARDPFVVCP